MTFDDQAPRETAAHQKPEGPKRTILRFSLAIAWITALSFDSVVLSQSGILWYLGHGSFVLLAFLLSYISTQTPVTNAALALQYTLLFLIAAVAIWLSSFPKAILAPVLLTIWASFLPFLFQIRMLFMVWVIVNCIFISVLVWIKPGIQHTLSGISFIGFQLFSIATTSAMINAEQKREELEKTHNKLRSAQAMLSEVTKNEERLRIARDMHDSIGHRLTALSLALEHARHKPPSDTTEFYAKLKEDVSLTLNELRTIVSETRRQSVTSISHILQLLASEMPDITLECEEDIALTHTTLAQQIIYCLQEGMSNAIRHGHANHFNVTYRKTPQHCIVLKDNGQCLSEISVGNGLKGMQERLSPFGGQAVLSAEKDGTTLSLSFQLPHDRL